VNFMPKDTDNLKNQSNQTPNNSSPGNPPFNPPTEPPDEDRMQNVVQKLLDESGGDLLSSNLTNITDTDTEKDISDEHDTSEPSLEISLDPEEFGDEVIKVGDIPVTIRELYEMLQGEKSSQEAYSDYVAGSQILRSFVDNPLQFSLQVIDAMFQNGVLPKEAYQDVLTAFQKAVGKINTQALEAIKQHLNQQLFENRQQMEAMRQKAQNDLKQLEQAVGRKLNEQEIYGLRRVIEDEYKKQGKLISIFQAWRILRQSSKRDIGGGVPAKPKPKASVKDLELDELAELASREISG
jgi:hypothetical protein